MLPIAPDTLLQQRYRILNILAEGGLGRTYMAIDRNRDDAYCAIEELIPSSQLASAVAGAKEFFKQEVTLLYQLQHPQIPHFWTTFEEQNRLFLVRDYITGKTYGHLLEERRDRGTTFSGAEVRQLLGQILPVIGYIHSKGIVHGDLSPEHIIHRDSDGLPVLIDFGVIREFANKLQATPAHQQMSPGQIGYAPAEQLHNKQAYPNGDLYAVAVTAIVLMTGKEPSALFEGDIMNWGWRQWTQIDDGFAQILSRMLSPAPGDRYQSAIEVERDLRSLYSPKLQPPEGLNSDRPSTIPTVVAGGKSTLPVTARETAITNRSAKSIWEQPQVFIPLGVLISLLAGVGSWFGVTQLLHRQASDPVTSVPPKQDFNNPTIPTDSSPSPIASDLIQPEMDRAILKEGTVNADTPIRYRIAALAGQNLDIELVPAIDPTKSLSSPISPIAPSGTKDTKFVNPPISVPTSATTQVLMTILSPTGTPIDNKSDRVVNWRGQVQTSGDYTVELRPIKGLAGSEFAYKLSITQLAVTPTPSPVPSPSAGIPSPGVPLPIGGNGINGSPANLNPDRIDRNNIPGISPSSLPIEVPTTRPTPTPTESERPTRRRRRNRTQVEPSPQVRERNRVESTDESTPTPRRRRNRVESTDESTPTPRRRRNRDSETRQPQSTPSNPDIGDNAPSDTPKPEPSIGITVPTPKNNTPPARDGDRAAPPPGSGANDPD